MEATGANASVLVDKFILDRGFMNKSANNPGDEYIDFIDVLAFIWKAKVWVLTGLLLGIACASLVIALKKPPVFISTVPVSLEFSSGLNSGEIVSKFSPLVTSHEIRSVFAEKGLLIDGQVPVKLVLLPSGNKLEVMTRDGEPSGARALFVAETFTKVAREMNRKIEDFRRLAKASAQEPAIETDAQVRFTLLAALQAKEESRFRLRLFELEAKLFKKFGSKPIVFSSDEANILGDSVLKLVGFLGDRLPDSERSEILSERDNIVASINSVQAKYEEPLRILKESMQTLSQDLIRTVNLDADKVTVIVPDELAFKGLVVTGSHERFESKRTLYLALGLLFGGMIGLIGYGLKEFFIANRDRVIAIF